MDKPFTNDQPPRVPSLDAASAALLTAATTSPEDAAKVMLWMEEEPTGATSNFALLAAEVDESSYPLAAWVEGLLAMHGWLAERGLTTDFPTAIGYTGCCATLQGKGGSAPASDLRSAVLEMLDKYGMDAAQPIAQA